jgi:adenylate cyclase
MQFQNSDLLLSSKELHTLLVCDVVESVAWMEFNEDEAIFRWQTLSSFVRRIANERVSTQIIKSTGDGFVLLFDDPISAIRVAVDINSFLHIENSKYANSRSLALRIGIHTAHIRRDAHDVYGHGINVTARIASLARPNEIIVSEVTRRELVDGLDANFEDMGECFLKHLAEPQRVYRVLSAQSNDEISTYYPIAPVEIPKPRVAVVPFKSIDKNPSWASIGDLIADGVIAQLGQSRSINMVSRLSTTCFQGREKNANEIGSLVNAHYSLQGSYLILNERLVLNVQLCDSKTNSVIWSERLSAPVSDLVQQESQICHELSTKTHDAITQTETEVAKTQPLPSVPSYGLLVAGINLLHDSTISHFAKSKEILDHLVERHPRSSTVRAWRAKWQLMKTFNGMTTDPKRDAQQALEDTQRSLDSDESHPLTLAVQGQIYSQFFGDGDKAVSALNQSLKRDQSESLAWLFKSAHSVMWGTPADAVFEVESALSLSWLDPQRYLFDMFYANALLTVHRHSDAIIAAKSSIRRNQLHAPTIRILLTAQYEFGDIVGAHDSLRLLMKIQPSLTITSYIGLGSSQAKTRIRCIEALRALGVPEN